MPSSPKLTVSKSQKASLIQETVQKHLANTTLTSSSGFEKAPSKVPGSVALCNQTQRLGFAGQLSAHDSRFEPFDSTPPISTAYKYWEGRTI